MILGLGCIAHDDVLLTEATWAEGKGRISQREERFGGNVRNALATVAALGGRAGYLATVGTSLLGDRAVADLRGHGVLLDFIQRYDGADPVASTIVIGSDGERFIAFDDAPLASTPLPEPAVIQAALDASDVLLVDAPTAPPGSLDVVLDARSRGLPVVLDAERDPTPAVLALVEAANHLIIPIGFAQELTGQSDPILTGAALWSADRSAIVLTDGPGGAHVFEAATSHKIIPAFSVTAVDTTGCGDAFHGAYAWSLQRQHPLAERVLIASAAAAVLASLPVGTPRVPDLTAVAAFTPFAAHPPSDAG